MNIDLTDLLEHGEDGYGIPCHKDNGSVNIMAKSSTGDTLLHVAVARHNIQETQYLLDNGLDINAQGDYLETPLYHAAALADIAMTAILLKKGADPNIPDHRGDLPKDILFRKLKDLPLACLESLSAWQRENSIGEG